MEPVCVHCRQPIEGYTPRINDTHEGTTHFICWMQAALNGRAKPRRKA